MANEEVILTPEGRQRLVDELAWREGERAKEITEAIRTAKAFGDLSENAEYDAAKDEQAKNEAKIAELRSTLAKARISEDQDSSTVSIGCEVTLEDGSGKTLPLQIVGTTETNSLMHMISNESPVGKALMGHRVGDTVEVTAPNGSHRSYKIVAIDR